MLSSHPTRRETDLGDPHKAPAAFAPLSRLIEVGLTAEASHCIDEILAQGIRLDEYGMVMPQADRGVLHKIAADFAEVRQRIGQALADGKHVLDTPGRYALVHAGHAAYIMECTQYYLRQHPQLCREDLYVVVLADDDVLVEGVKPVHLKAAECWDREHAGRHPRPIQRIDYFGHITSVHPRLLDLASLPVDLAGLIPNPIAFGSSVYAAGHFQEWLARGRDIPPLAEGGNPLVREAVQKYARLMRLLTGDGYGKVVESFNRARLNLGYEPQSAVWDVRSWQLLMHRYLGNVHSGGFQERYVRLLSNRDEKYKDEAAAVMGLCHINHMFIDDLHLFSTTTLLEHFGWEALLEAKQRSLEALKDNLPDPTWRR